MAQEKGWRLRLPIIPTNYHFVPIWDIQWPDFWLRNPQARMSPPLTARIQGTRKRPAGVCDNNGKFFSDFRIFRNPLREHSLDMADYSRFAVRRDSGVV